MCQRRQNSLIEREKSVSYTHLDVYKRQVQAVSFAAHTLPNAFCVEHTLVLLVLVLPALVGVENETCPIWYG